MNTFLTVVLFIAWLALVAILSIVSCYFAHGCIKGLREKHKTTGDIWWCITGIFITIFVICVDIIIIVAPFI